MSNRRISSAGFVTTRRVSRFEKAARSAFRHTEEEMRRGAAVTVQRWIRGIFNLRTRRSSLRLKVTQRAIRQRCLKSWVRRFRHDKIVRRDRAIAAAERAILEERAAAVLTRAGRRFISRVLLLKLVSLRLEYYHGVRGHDVKVYAANRIRAWYFCCRNAVHHRKALRFLLKSTEQMVAVTLSLQLVRWRGARIRNVVSETYDAAARLIQGVLRRYLRLRGTRIYRFARRHDLPIPRQ